MNNKIFNTKTTNPPAVDTINNAGGLAYELDDGAALAQLICTGCINNTFYTKAEEQLDKIVSLASNVDNKFIAKLAVYARQEAYMKDTPPILLAILSKRDVVLFKKVAPKVLDNMKMIRNFITVIRSGKTGRKSLGSTPKKYIRNFINKLSDEELYRQTIGNSPSFKDIMNLVHPKPLTPSRDALYKYLLNKDTNTELLPKVIQELELYKKKAGPIPNIDWQFLSCYNPSKEDYKVIAKNMNWHALRMNLNNLSNKDVFEDKNLTKEIANKLNDKEIINKIKLFPYQVYNTLINTNKIPTSISNALQDALDISVSNLQAFTKINKLFICVDSSSSMNSAVTGDRGSVTTKVTCSHAAAIYAGAIIKANSNLDIEVIKFDTTAKAIKLNAKDSMWTLANSLIANGGGTNVSSSFDYIKKTGLKKSDNIAIIVISDNESWQDYHNNLRQSAYGINKLYTGSAELLTHIKNKVSSVKTVLVDIQPNTSTQIKDSPDVLNIGGFSDSIFPTIFNFIENNSQTWIDEINKINT